MRREAVDAARRLRPEGGDGLVSGLVGWSPRLIAWAICHEAYPTLDGADADVVREVRR